MRKSRLIALFVALAALNIAPLLLFPLGGDALFHDVLIDCFGRQLWQGDLYPRWCFDANAGLGSPVFYFYFPLAYYASALFYPLKFISGSLGGIEYVHAASCFAASLLALFCCYRWLRGQFGVAASLAGAALYLFMPYRLEAMLFRASLSEVWALALLPWWFSCVQRMARGDGDLPKCALAFALLLLAHVPVALAGGVGAGVYLLLAGRPVMPSLVRLTAALALAALLGALYIVPAFYYQQFIGHVGEIDSARGWPNGFMSAANFYVGQARPVLMALATALLGVGLIWRARNLAAARPFAMLLLVACFLLTPLSRPLWELIGPFKTVMFPWRMQALIALAVVYLLALCVEHSKHRKTGDAVAALMFASLLPFFMMSVRDENYAAKFAEILYTNTISALEYRTIWTDGSQMGMEPTLLRGLEKHARTEVISGAAAVAVKAWEPGAIDLHVTTFAPALVRLDHRFFPSWKALNRLDGATATLRPERHSGLMVLDLPKGEYRLELRESALNGHGWLMHAAFAASLLAWIFLLLKIAPLHRINAMLQKHQVAETRPKK